MDRLEGQVQGYAWGDRHTIARLQHRRSSREPEAELWFGAHPVAPSRLIGEGRTLADAVAADRTRILGPSAGARFAAFPYLLKILAAARPLSIQAHPSRDQARSGFEREERAGIAWDSPVRTYRDDNHKPELICALTPFEAKCGFRPLARTRSLVRALADAGGPGLRALDRGLVASGPDGRVVADVLGWLLNRPPTEARDLVSEAVMASRCLLDRADPGLGQADDEAALRSVGPMSELHPTDVGVVVALLLNHVSLSPGQALFLDAGNLHCYLAGSGVELMANSDNVVRGGLTAKHVDTDELLAIVDTEPGPAPIQTPTGPDHRYRSPVADFAMTRLVGDGTRDIEPVGPEMVLVTEGEVELSPADGGPTLTIASGQAGFVAGTDGPYRLTPDGPAEAWRATVGGEEGTGPAIRS